jgi:RNA polymerase sigma factor for flagellar operon FliA
MGALAVLIDRLTTRDRHTHDEAYEIVTVTHRAALSRGEFDAIVGRLPERMGRRFVSDAALSELAAASPGPDQALIDDETVDRERQVRAALRRAMTALPAQDRLVLTMRFLDGRTVAEIARALRLDQKVLYRRVDKLLAELRRQLEAAGVGESAARDILEA